MALILLQISYLYTLYKWFFNYFKWFAVVSNAFAIVMVFYLFNSGMDASAKLTWMLLIMVVPVAGAFFLWFSKRDFGHRALRQMVLERISESEHVLGQDQEVLRRPELVDAGVDDLLMYMNRSGSFQVYADSDVTYYPVGESAYEAMLQALSDAKRTIYLEYFIISEGVMWNSILKVLKEKAAQGVDVRVLYDGMCEMTKLPRSYPKRLQKEGIQCRLFSPIMPFLSTYYNYRDHRKIMVIDDEIAFTGGMNLADEYINQIQLFGHWKDAVVRVQGPAVTSFSLMFLQMWNLPEKEPKWEIAMREQSCLTEKKGFVIPYCDHPLDSDQVGEMVYIDMLSRAKSYVHIMTPYLMLDNELEMAITFAAKRGVDVKLILPGIPDKKIPYAMAKSYYKNLLEAGVKIYEYAPGFLHSKVFVSDDERAVVGTINLDYRSLYHHFECATYLYRCPCIADVERDVQETLKKCRVVTMEVADNERFLVKLIGTVMKVFAPLM